MNNYVKMLVASVMLLMLNIQAMFAVDIEYKLKTHVDGRTISQSVNLTAGASLEDNMPQKFWRAYTTYTYYSDEELTQKITKVPSEDATIYVDYFFEPPFVKCDDEITVWYMLRAFYANSSAYYWYVDGDNVSAVIYSKLNTIDDEDKTQWAFYGDGYCLNLKNKYSNEWLGYPEGCEHPTHSNKQSPLLSPTKLDIGWQLYLSTFEKDHIQQWLLGVPQDNDELSVTNGVLGLENMSGATYMVSPQMEDNQSSWTNQAVLDYSKNKTMWCLFFGTMGKNDENIWHVEYRVYHEYNDIIDRYFYNKEKEDRSVDYYFVDKKSWVTYEYYHDEEMTVQWFPNDPNDMIKTKPNDTIYVKEILPQKEQYVTDHWITIVLPYNVENLAEFFGTASDGETPAVRVLEYDGLNIEEYPYYNLHFKKVFAIEKDKPYLFKADEILADKYLPLAMGPTAETTGNESDLITISFNDEGSTRPDVFISMVGTYSGKDLVPTAMAPDENGEVDYIYFYFGYNPKYDSNSSSYVGESAAEGKYPYNFYPVKKSVAMPQNRCYFKIYSNEGNPVGYSQLGVSNDDVITGVSELLTESKAFHRLGIYHISGKRMNNVLIKNLPKGMYIVNGEKVIIK